MSKYIDLNCDMGESYYDKIVGNDSKIMPYITSSIIMSLMEGTNPSLKKRFREEGRFYRE